VLAQIDLKDPADPYGRALGYYRRMLLKPRNAFDLIFYAALCLVDCRFEEAEHWIDQCLERWPGDQHALHQKAILHLMNNDYERGLPMYETRFTAYPEKALGPPLPQWDGKPTDKPVVLWQEGGFGDAVLPARYIPAVVARCPNTQVFVDPTIRSLFELSGLLEDVKSANTISGDGYQCSLLSLLNVMGASPDNIDDQPYLHVPDKLVEHWGQRCSGQSKIGFCWSGNPKWDRDVLRSMPLDVAKRLESVIHVMPVVQQHTGAKDWADTAAIISNLDLVLTTCTSIAHVAGAVGKPVWIMLARDSDWRWGRYARYSHWYKSAVLFRAQARRGIRDREVYNSCASALRVGRQREAKQCSPSRHRCVVASFPAAASSGIDGTRGDGCGNRAAAVGPWWWLMILIFSMGTSRCG
jgi:hypothetical protein